MRGIVGLVVVIGLLVPPGGLLLGLVCCSIRLSFALLVDLLESAVELDRIGVVVLVVVLPVAGMTDLVLMEVLMSAVS